MTRPPRAMICGISLVLLFTVTLVSRAAEEDKLLHDRGVKGGLIVAGGCDDPTLLVGLKADDRYLVQAIDHDVGKVVAARD